MGDSTGLEELLYLDGTIISQSDGCWVKIEAKTTKQITAGRPHGIRYSLTLHTRSGKRILGYDNAHPIREKKGKHAAHRHSAYDHKHKNAKDKGQPYHFINAQQLMIDFWKDVDKTLKKYQEEK